MLLKLKHLSFAGLTATLALFMGAGVGPEVNALDVYSHKTARVAVQENLQYGLGISPSKLLDLSLKPGQSYEGVYSIYNEGRHDISVVVGISPFSYSADYKNIDLIRGSSYNQIQEWVEIDQGPISLKSGEIKTMPFKIDVPEDIRGGGQYFAFINRINPGSEPDEQGGTINGVKQIGLTVGTRINAEGLDACGKIIDQQISFWQPTAPLVTTATIENCGNIDFTAYGRLKIENALFGGGVIYETPAGKDIAIQVFPNGESTTREKEINWEEAPALGLFNVTQTISIGDKTETLVKTVLMLPFWVILVMIIVIVIIVVAIVLERKVRNKHKLRKK